MVEKLSSHTIPSDTDSLRTKPSMYSNGHCWPKVSAIISESITVDTIRALMISTNFV